VTSTVCHADVRFRRRGWSNYELAQFHRMIAILCGVGVAFETDSGVTDEGEPWLVLCETDSDEMFAHFARIGGEYVVCAPCLKQLLTGITLRQLVDHFIDLCPCRRAASVQEVRARDEPRQLLRRIGACLRVPCRRPQIGREVSTERVIYLECSGPEHSAVKAPAFSPRYVGASLCQILLNQMIRTLLSRKPYTTI
jgi:hypothetical protein